MPKLIIDMPEDIGLFTQLLKLLSEGKEGMELLQYRSKDLMFLPASQLDLLTKEACPNITKVVVLSEN